MDYKNSVLINSLIQPHSISNYILDKLIINGFIYRGDHHNYNMVRPKPTFYSDYETGLSYIGEHKYIKKFKTNGDIVLISLNNTPENTRNIHKFFTEFLLPKHDKTYILVTLILLQVCYGLIDGPMSNLNLYGLTTDDIDRYLSNKIDGSFIDDFLYIIEDMNIDTINPSRVSYAPIDKLLMKSLKELLEPYNIHGIWYMGRKYENNDLCYAVNKELFELESQRMACVPSELCIFEPDKHLINIESKQMVEGRFVSRSSHNKSNKNKNKNKNKYKYYKYKNKYKNLKNKYLNTGNGNNNND